ncbi:hypothetical protein BP6252_07451 [Coleophoma cylindrospora]|uniref:Phospholipid/glycerol acyltransferase domain-containing protein n=1 Tax=Coleophoma cylindrospora TaxID=1849047 RepID=A0A3D8RI26_9HELO|nr:hypothetical protein BP6252_07451 [Coleophoma cylindrospora]
MANLIGAVPISRAMDVAKSGKGTIYLPDPANNPLLLKGIGTDFTGPDFQPGYSIYLPSINGEAHKLDIAQIHGPDMISLKTAPVHSDAIFQLTGSKSLTSESLPGYQGSKYKVAPHIDQTDVYNAVFQRLESGGCIGIFPEGGSHDRTSLLPLKAGIAIMALGSLARGTPVTIVPVGMNYFSAHKFRSRAVIEFGDAITIPASLVQDFQAGKKRDAVGNVMSQISEALASVTVSAPDYDTLMLIHIARHLYLNGMSHHCSNAKPSLASTTELNRRLLKGYNNYSHTPEMMLLTKNLKAYRASLRKFQLTDRQLLATTSNHTHFPLVFLLPKLLYRLLKLVILSILTLPGLLLFSPVFLLTSYISRRKTAQALAESSVKVRGFDVMATWKILISGGLAPLFYTFYAVVAVALNTHNHAYGFLPAGTQTWAIVLSTYAILPSITYAALIFGEQGMDLLKSLYPLVLSVSPRSASMLKELRVERQRLVLQVQETVNRFGADLFPDCDEVEKWRLRGPRSMYAYVSPLSDDQDLENLDEFV